MSRVPMTPLGLPDPGAPPVPVKTVTRWAQFLGSLAAGAGLPGAMEKHYISRADIETMTRSDPLELKRWNDARAAGRRTEWSVFDFEDIFARVSMGMKIIDAITEVRGRGDAHGFYDLVNRDPDLQAMYRLAKEAAMLIHADNVLDYADDAKNDVIEGAKGPQANMAAVGRSKLQVESRLTLMRMQHGKMFGEKANQVQVNVQINHAERLAEARTRAKEQDRRVTPRQLKDAIDATFSEAPPADTDTSWMDAKPTETVWREES